MTDTDESIDSSQLGNGPAESLPGDTCSPDACVLTLYTVISGSAEAQRDWTRFRALCRPDVRFLFATRRPDGTLFTEAYDLDRFIDDAAKEFAVRGLWEQQLVSRTEQFGRVAHVFSSYETRVGQPDAPVVARGVNSIQLIQEADGGWRIAQLAWDREAATQPLPTHLATRREA